MALEQIENAFSVEPQNLDALKQKIILLGQESEYDEAEQSVNSLIENYPEVAETWALVGRVEKDAWLQTWINDCSDNSSQEALENATDAADLLKEAIDPYRRAFKLDPRHYHSGINALTLLHILKHLTNDDQDDRSRIVLEGSSSMGN